MADSNNLTPKLKTNVLELFERVGKGFGWFQYENADVAIKALSEKKKKKTRRKVNPEKRELFGFPKNEENVQSTNESNRKVRGLSLKSADKSCSGSPVDPNHCEENIVPVLKAESLRVLEKKEEIKSLCSNVMPIKNKPIYNNTTQPWSKSNVIENNTNLSKDDTAIPVPSQSTSYIHLYRESLDANHFKPTCSSAISSHSSLVSESTRTGITCPSKEIAFGQLSPIAKNKSTFPLDSVRLSLGDDFFFFKQSDARFFKDASVGKMESKEFFHFDLEAQPQEWYISDRVNLESQQKERSSLPNESASKEKDSQNETLLKSSRSFYAVQDALVQTDDLICETASDTALFLSDLSVRRESDSEVQDVSVQADFPHSETKKHKEDQCLASGGKEAFKQTSVSQKGKAQLVEHTGKSPSKDSCYEGQGLHDDQAHYKLKTSASVLHSNGIKLAMENKTGTDGCSIVFSGSASMSGRDETAQWYSGSCTNKMASCEPELLQNRKSYLWKKFAGDFQSSVQEKHSLTEETLDVSKNRASLEKGESFPTDYSLLELIPAREKGELNAAKSYPAKSSLAESPDLFRENSFGDFLSDSKESNSRLKEDSLVASCHSFDSSPSLKFTPLMDYRKDRSDECESSEDDLEAFFEKNRTPKPKLPMAPSPGFDNFISDSEMSSDECDSLFYIKTSRLLSTNRFCGQPLLIPSFLDFRPYGSIPHHENQQKSNSKSSKKQQQNLLENITEPKVDKQYSFLSSLSQQVEFEKRRHPEALRYVKQFKKYREDLSAHLFQLYNKTVFDNQLPKDMPVKWNKRLLNTAGYFKKQRTCVGHFISYSGEVHLGTKVCDSAERVRCTLIHELCHAAVWLVNRSRECHGPIWNSWARKAVMVHPELPPITRCHTFSITTKYIYECMGCGKRIGRHSRSLDTHKRVCRFCHGHFTLLQNKEGRSATPARTPNRFAMFVKENYREVRQNTTTPLTHKQVMNILSSEFKQKNTISDD